ncbi:MAG: IS256 family transposase [Akkermansiaceae bacterium]|nr:IS256 family transposase [Armatimonadota bacterium]
MTHQPEDNALVALLPLLTGTSDNPLAQVLTVLLNAAMKHEWEKHIGAAPYERTEERNGQSNGYKVRSLSTRLGKLNLSVPQVRGSEEPFHPQSLDAALLSEKALKVALAEMYVQGVSTRRVSAVLESLCGTSISSMTVSRASAELDEVLKRWRNRPLGGIPYLQCDAIWVKIRQDGLVRDAAVLIASGVNEEGKRSLLGVSVSASESELHWRSFFESLVARGLRGVRLITSDDHSGIRAARRAVFGGVAWQRCQFHLQQNAQSYVPKEEMKREVASKIRSISTASDLVTAQGLLKMAVKEYEKTAPKLSLWMESAIAEGLAVLSLPETQRRVLRTTDGLKRVNKELRRRFRVVGSFVSESSCLRLASAVLMEISDGWETGKVYLTMEKLEA